MSSLLTELWHLRPRLPRLWLGGITDWEMEFEHEKEPEVARKGIHKTIDGADFQTLVVFAAGMGILTDAYDIFAVNMILPMISYVYWDGAAKMPHWLWTMMICATLLGSIIGQIAFGIMGDMFGRKRMYGYELLIILWATLGLATSAAGSHNSMSISGWLIFWRLMMGIGIGGDYPLSAVITSEFAPTAHRKRMLASVFFMQPIGQFLGTLFATGVIHGFRDELPHVATSCATAAHPENCYRAVDRAWRLIVGLGALPALLAVGFRLTIPESPRYTLDVLKDEKAAIRTIAIQFDPKIHLQQPRSAQRLKVPVVTASAVGVGPRISPSSSETQTEEIELAGYPSGTTSEGEMRQRRFGAQDHNHENGNLAGPSSHIGSLPNPPTTEQPPDQQNENSSNLTQPIRFSRHSNAGKTEKRRPVREFWSGLKRYLLKDRNWVHLVGTTWSWFLLDFAFYGLGMSSTATIQKLFNGLPSRSHPYPLSVYQTLYENAWHSMIVVSLGALAGGATLIWLVGIVRPVKIQALFFCALGLLMFGVGESFKPILESASPALAVPWPLILMYILCQFLFNIGPNSTTFIIPAEQFPTQYRCTCNGFSAAMGKLGSFLVQIILVRLPFHDSSQKLVRWDDPSSTGLRVVLLVFGGIMLLGAIVTVYAVPDSSHPDTRINNEKVRGKSMTLEELAQGREYMDAFIPKRRLFWRPRWHTIVPAQEEDIGEDNTE